jgi:pimeloyl-ACP methyl ester carboxylesterase
MTVQTARATIVGEEHWATKATSDGDVRLFVWRKRSRSGDQARGTVVLVHGSSMGSVPSFDLQVPGVPDSSLMDFLVDQGYDAWTLDMEGYRRSRGARDVLGTVAEGAQDLVAATDYIRGVTGVGQFLMYGVSSGALRAALFAQHHPERVKRLALDAFVWTGEGSPTLEQRRKRLPELLSSTRRPLSREFVRTIFTRDHPGCADERVVEAFADAILAEEDSVPNGTYIDMCQNLPLVDPRQINVPTLIMRGEYDGIASFEDLVEFFRRLPHPDKHFAVMPGIAHASMHLKNYRLAQHIVAAFFGQPEPVYRGEPHA